MDIREPGTGPRSGYRSLLAVWLLFVLYGSLLPFDFTAEPMSSVLDRLWVACLDFRIESRSDFVANVLLMIPSGFLVAGACLQNRHGRLRTLLTWVAVTLAGTAMSAAIEITQAFLPERVMSPSDVVAETIGTATGALLWIALQSKIAVLVRAARLSRPGPIGRVLLGYVAALLAWRLSPLDLTLDLAVLHRKYVEGRMFPFGAGEMGVTRIALGAGAGILIYMPVGVVAGLLWGEGRRAGPALAAAAIVMFTAELGRVFVLSASVDLTWLAPGIVGVACGVWMARRARASAGHNAPAGGEMHA